MSRKGGMQEGREEGREEGRKGAKAKSKEAVTNWNCKKVIRSRCE
jgi:predicted transposase YdaD